MKTIYLASPLGFTESGQFFLKETLHPTLAEAGFKVLDPWSLTAPEDIEKVQLLEDPEKRLLSLSKLNRRMAENNLKALRSCDLVLAVLDGVDVDSGVASEIGFAAANGKMIIGYRSDLRRSGENKGAQVNLQVQHFILKSGGLIFKTLIDLKFFFSNELDIE